MQFESGHEIKQRLKAIEMEVTVHLKAHLKVMNIRK